MGISQLKWECLHRLTQESMLCTQNAPVYTVFSQPIAFKLGTQTLNQQMLCQHNICLSIHYVNTVWTVTVFGVNWFYEYSESEQLAESLSLEPESNGQLR